MHPVLARFLAADVAKETLRKQQAGGSLTPEEMAFAEAAKAHPRQASILMDVGGRALSSDAQAAVVLLAAHASVRAMQEDAELSERARKAREALAEEGASEEETDAFIASILLEEAFGYEQDVDTFDREYVMESLGEVPALAALTKEAVDALFLGFVKGAADDAERKVRETMARALFDIAWAEGPAPINPEHIEALLDAEVADKPEEEQEAKVHATAHLLQALAREGLMGPLRLSRLRAMLGEEDA
ncbi:hypothetical protein MYSTI_02284 [Myxococcus stipitatus DSM 14675]|uniref:Uncharacterized protein n=1 Tax=Myxococcus stipitatus (strain DSM 14675 / JCM 12634 / Mx s8) TaxID=1278073 RepID=L7U485_MYXSD|nr:hypothetical protein [Myxococcus stipitatus]AGC43606.1 hypothetical protein MYSTI_02284 [Myxococcus stipitatus DSM 14675]